MKVLSGPLGGQKCWSLLKGGLVMRHVDFTPFYRSTVGFDRLFDLLGSGSEAEANVYPPYNIERLSDNEYRITMAVAGFSQDELKIDVKEQALNVRGEKKAEDKGREFLHRGIAARTFEQRFQLADHVEVKGADLKDGLLNIDLVRNVPERLKPRTIAIGADKAPAQVEAKAA
jgi:molecular chaperone IbpA